MKKLLAALATVALFIPTCSLLADENLLGYSYGSETLPKGKWEFYNWATARLGKGEGKYHAFDFKQELEVGVTDRFQVSLYFNERYHDYSGGSVEGAGSLHRFAYEGNQIAFKYAFLSPYKDPVGLALYVEPGYSLITRVSGEKVTELGVEAKILLEKHFLEDQLVTILNVTGEFEWERARPARGEDFDGELVWEVTGGVTYRVARNWHVGVEARYRTAFPNMDVSNQEYWAISAGPVIHYGAERWWATLTWLPQITGWPNDSDRSNNLHLDEQERNEVRLKVGINF